MHLLRLLIAIGLVSIALVVPASVSGANGPAPNEVCVPGTVWEDLASGVKYICIYDEMYGGSRWELLESGTAGRRVPSPTGPRPTAALAWQPGSAGCRVAAPTRSCARIGGPAPTNGIAWPNPRASCAAGS